MWIIVGVGITFTHDPSADPDVGAVKKSIAAVASRRFRRKASHRGAGLGSLGAPFHLAGDRSLGNIEPEHEKLAVNARCAPGRVLGDHTKDQIPYLVGRLSSARLPPDS